MRLPELWTVREPGPAVQDPSTGNRRRGAFTESSRRGLLQQRQLSASSVDAGNSEFSDGHVVRVFDLLLEPGPEPSPRATLVDSDGNSYQVVGASRTRRPAVGSRRPVYVAVVVRRSSDMKEV